ncbi:nitroreductase [Clostridium tertium]|uniref:nitroreductase n=1 Tax=Clostridium tertium TaxID=1559 RepID=UPI00291B4746|nr:nitroreductase [Clostridium sp.]
MLIDEKKYKKFKKQVEDDLQKYYYYLISIETPGLGQATRWDKVYEKSNVPSDPVSKTAIDDEYKRILVNAIDNIYSRLDEKSKKIIEEYYFKGNIIRPDEVMDKLEIKSSRYYELKKISLYKFMIGLGYC